MSTEVREGERERTLRMGWWEPAKQQKGKELAEKTEWLLQKFTRKWKEDNQNRRMNVKSEIDEANMAIKKIKWLALPIYLNH